MRDARKLRVIIASAALIGLAAVDVPRGGARAAHPIDAVKRLPGAIGALPPSPDSAANPSTPAKIELGRRLFFDVQLSLDRSTSCSTCHDPEKGFADGRPIAVGLGGRLLDRHTPTVLNAAYNEPQFWDGRAMGLEQQAVVPITAPAEMNMTDEAELIARLEAEPRYRALFREAFGGGPTLQRVGHALAAYERTLVTGNSRFDLYANGDKTALTDAEKRGLLLFVGKAACTQCHLGPNFTDNKFYALGLPERGKGDAGRFEVTKSNEDRGAFKTPTLRNVAITPPYMHDGSLGSLQEVVDFYDRGGDAMPRSELMRKLDLTGDEKHDLIAFLESLTGTPGPTASRPVDE
jgi:cytochrome c peroxidase